MLFGTISLYAFGVTTEIASRSSLARSFLKIVKDKSSEAKKVIVLQRKETIMLHHLLRSIFHHSARNSHHAFRQTAQQIAQNAAQQAVTNPLAAAGTVIGAADLGMKIHEKLTKEK